MQSLTHVGSVVLSTRNLQYSRLLRPNTQSRGVLFPSATSVTLVGQMHYLLAKLILNSINPATLKYLCLDVVQDRSLGLLEDECIPGDRGEDGRLVAHGATAGLLTTVTGRYNTPNVGIAKTWTRGTHCSPVSRCCGRGILHRMGGFHSFCAGDRRETRVREGRRSRSDPR